MAVGLEVSYTDFYGKVKRGRYTVADAAAAGGALQTLANLTNASITQANLLTPVDISGLTNNTPQNLNFSAAEAQASISMSGAIPAGATRRPRVTIRVPAFIATFVTTGDEVNTSAPEVQALLTNLLSNRGETLNRVDSGRVL